ncbi:hypothetical protein GIB67_010380, partial [Kingdonia uniflora]
GTQEAPGLVKARVYSRDEVWEQLIGSQRRAVGSTNANKLDSRSHFLIHTQGCHQMMDEAEKDYKNMSDRIVASVEVMKTSYADFITEAQTSAAQGTLILHVFSSHVVDFPEDIGSHFICLHEKATILTILMLIALLGCSGSSTANGWSIGCVVLRPREA